MSNNVYLITYMQNCPECEGKRTLSSVFGRCTICDGTGAIFVRTSLIAALRDLKQQGKLP